MMKSQDIRTALNWMNRAKLEDVFESAGFQCSDSESDDDLRHDLFENIQDGTIAEHYIL